MSFRDTILQNVLNNQPSARELPAVPKFHSGQPVDLKRGVYCGIERTLRGSGDRASG